MNGLCLRFRCKCAQTERTHVLAFACVLSTIPAAAMAIPSPELIIGSASSISQVFAVAAVTVGGFFAFIARRLGFRPSAFDGRRVPVRMILGLVGVILCLSLLNVWQFRAQKTAEVEHLQATLTRPAQFDGTRIQDQSLKETNFRSQQTSAQSISTDEAQRLLEATPGESSTVFFDVRETGEHQMGTLPGARHVRFPDFSQSLIPQGQKVVLFCHNGNRSSETCEALAAMGIDCNFIAGGIEKWIVEGRPFSDKKVRTLSDLRAIPEFPNRDKLIGTQEFKKLLASGDLQILDARYPGDFEIGHLPGAINIPVRALPTHRLERIIASLEDKPTMAACYDRRSCFMSQVLGLELHNRGIEFVGRYTTPWEYFVPPEPKPHVQEWLSQQEKSAWQMLVEGLASTLVRVDIKSHLLIGLLALSLISRVLVLPIALKSERDQLVSSQHADEVKAIKSDLRNDPVRKARALQAFYARKGMTPMRNLLGLLFLPLMMLGVAAAEIAARETAASFLWYDNLGDPDGVFLLPVLLALLGTSYLIWVVGKTPRQKLLWSVLGFVSILVLVLQFTAATLMYLCVSLFFLLVQRTYVTGAHRVFIDKVKMWRWMWGQKRHYKDIWPLALTEKLSDSGNKSLRLSELRNAGFPVPKGLVIGSKAIEAFKQMNAEERRLFSAEIWRLIDQKTCAVRSSARDEDGADHSYAGIFESVLDVDAEGMEGAIQEVVDSFSSERVGSYCAEAGKAHNGNILVQQMVQSDYAGVLFTRDPTAAGQMMVELVEGCGDDLVSGRKSPQSLRFGRFSLSALDEETAPIDLMPLLDMGQRIEKLFGCPQDIEWAYSGGAFQIVQSRDVTAAVSSKPEEVARRKEWHRFFDRFGEVEPENTAFEQDEMSELLPHPTPLSFSFMGALWAPGGSVDLACRELGIGYELPEGQPGHLVNIFGKTYVDVNLKAYMAARLPKSKAKQLVRTSREIATKFPSPQLQSLDQRTAYWRAMDFEKLTVEQILECLQKLRDEFINGAYVEAEKINILAGLTMAEALTATESDSAARNKLMNPVLKFSPASLIETSFRLPQEQQSAHLLQTLGHRAHFDYEFSEPRHEESPERVLDLLKGITAPSPREQESKSEDLSDIVSLAIKMQDLKEKAKHEALRLVAQMRRAVLALGYKSGLSDLVFQLEWDELLQLDQVDLVQARAKAEKRKMHADLVAEFAPDKVSLTLSDCERLSGSKPFEGDQDSTKLRGTCVAGSKKVSGRVFVVSKPTGSASDAFKGFRDGDIIVCPMVSPKWLPFVQRSGGVLSEIGGWLSHMAIVGREKDILMLVKCVGLKQLATGTMIDVGTDGSIVSKQLEVG